MRRYVALATAILASMVLGYFAGREHVKYELRSTFASAAHELQRSLSSAFGSATTVEQEQSSKETKSESAPDQQDAIGAAYIAEHLELYDVTAGYRESLVNGTVPGVLFKIRNTGDRSLDRVEVTIYFKDEHGNIIAEEDYSPVLVSEHSFSEDNKPLKPGYIWQMEQGKFYAAKSVPTEWSEGNIQAAITDIRFSE